MKSFFLIVLLAGTALTVDIIKESDWQVAGSVFFVLVFNWSVFLAFVIEDWREGTSNGTPIKDRDFKPRGER